MQVQGLSTKPKHANQNQGSCMVLGHLEVSGTYTFPNFLQNKPIHKFKTTSTWHSLKELMKETTFSQVFLQEESSQPWMCDMYHTKDAHH